MLGDANQIDNVTIIWNDVFEASAFGNCIFEASASGMTSWKLLRPE